MPRPPSDTPGVLIYPPIAFLLTTGLGIGLQLVHPISIGPRSLLRIVGATLAVLAGTIALLAAREIKRAGSNIHPNHPTTAIVTRGPYRWTRNPMYLSLCLLATGIGLYLGGLAPVLSAPVLAFVLHWGVILREERYLQRKFGAPYATYRATVRRWF